MLTFVNLDAATAPEWDQVVYGSDDGWAFHLAGWLMPTALVWKRQCHSFAAVEAGRMIGVMPLGLDPETGVMSSGAWTDGGPVVLAELSEARRRKVCTALLDRALEMARERNARRLHVSLTPLSPASLNSRWGVNPLLELGFSDVSTHAWIVDLGPPEAELWARLSENITRQIKKARARGYVVELHPWEGMFDRFYELHCETYARNGLPPHPTGNFLPLKDVFAPAGHALLWVCFDRDRNPVGFHAATLFKQFGYYHVGNARTSHLDNGVNPLLFWTAMLELKSRGCRWYGLGEAFPLESGKAGTLSDFKRKFGSEMHRWFKGEIVLSVAEPGQPPVVSPPSPVRSWLRFAKASAVSLIRSLKRSA
jgi:hypothetical protein